jgi:hypothetical protein
MTTNTTKTARDAWAGGTAWMAGGACLPRGDLPWTADPEQSTAWQARVMGAICLGCPVLTDCAGFAEGAKVTAGFWAGRHRDIDGPSLADPGQLAETLPGLGGLGGAA